LNENKESSIPAITEFLNIESLYTSPRR